VRPIGAGALFAIVFVGGMDVGVEMLKNGLAWVYEKGADAAVMAKE